MHNLTIYVTMCHNAAMVQSCLYLLGLTLCRYGPY